MGLWRVLARVRADINLTPGCLGGAYHVERNDMFKGYLARLVLVDEDLVDLDRRRACGQTQDEGVGCCRSKGFDPVCRGVREATRRGGVGEGIPMMYWAM